MDLKKEIKQTARSLGIDLIGFTNRKQLKKVKPKLKLSKKLGYENPFITNDIKQRINPRLLLKSCQTIISFGLPYLKTSPNLKKMDQETVYFSSSSWGKDYHIVLKEKAELLMTIIKKMFPNLEYKILIDNHPLDDRFIAYQAGLGFYGINNLLINDKYGSYFFIGTILTNLKLKNDQPIKKKCLECLKCVETCPTKALDVKKGLLNSHLCLSYLTQKKELTPAEELYFDNCIYGCDICSFVCPHNEKNNESVDFSPLGIEFINLKKYESLSNKKWLEKYKILSGSWRGKIIIERNIRVCQKNKNMIKLKRQRSNHEKEE